MSSRLLDELKRSTAVELTVTGRRSGKRLPRPVAFTLSDDGKSLYLMPFRGRETRWYVNVKNEPMVTIRVGIESFSGEAEEVGPDCFKRVLETFVDKYGKADMDRYFPRKDIDPVAFEVRLP